MFVNVEPAGSRVRQKRRNRQFPCELSGCVPILPVTAGFPFRLLTRFWQPRLSLL